MASKQQSVEKSVARERRSAELEPLARARTPSLATPPVLATFEEITLRTDSVSLCLLLNRRARSMRVIDFRAGVSLAKRRAVEEAARRHGIEKIVLLVERDESIAWEKMGFRREGSIPGYYKRSDAFVMGLCVRDDLARETVADPSSIARSGVFSVATRERFTRPAFDEAPELDDDRGSPEIAVALARAEKLTGQAQKHATLVAARPRPVATLASANATAVARHLALATREGRAITGFERFGKDATRDDVVATVVGLGDLGDLVVGIELQASYRNAFVETLSAPRNERERDLHVAAIGAVCARLRAAGTVCAFAVTPASDLRGATAFVANGFRRTGVLRAHLCVGERRTDGLLWSAILRPGVAVE